MRQIIYKNLTLVFATFILLSLGFLLTNVSEVKAEILKSRLSGKILLQVEDNGEAWYVNPEDQHRYYLNRPSQALEIMRQFGLGVTTSDINKFLFGSTPSRLSGKILLQVEKNGQAYYVNPINLKLYYLGRPDDAFNLMRDLGLGITNSDLVHIPLGEIGETYSKASVSGSAYIEGVSFTTQAPYGDWSDQRQQDACEESSALMAVYWAQGKSLSKDEALAKITNGSDYTQDKYGEYRDISAEDTVNWIIKDYLNYSKVNYIADASLEDLINELDEGNLVIVPANGQALANPHFTSPGPPRHMLLLKGYDSSRHVFITNDPGTRYGEDYEYDMDVLWNAIRDYPTGYHEHIESIKKDLIVVYK